MELPINQIICGNCVDVLKTFPLCGIDLVVTSPPYDNLRDYKGYDFPFEEIVLRLKNVLKTGGVIVWVVGDATVDGSETGTSFEQALYFKKLGFNLHDTMIYAKNNYLPAQKNSNRYANGFEYVFIFSKRKPKTFNPIKEKCIWGGKGKVGTFRGKNGETTQRNVIINEEKTISNIWFYEVGYMKSTKNKIAYQHPAIFSEQLAIDHIKSWSNPNDVVLDPMCGSGTTCVAAKQLGRNYIGIDVSNEYCKIAKERISL